MTTKNPPRMAPERVRFPFVGKRLEAGQIGLLELKNSA
jgi:hypothetical protein